MAEIEDFPYRAEYAKSGRSSCRHCKSAITKDSLRLAAMVQSPVFDGKVPQWYHQMCFFAKQRPKAVTDIEHFDSLRWDDQQKLKQKIESGCSIVSSSEARSSSAKSKKGKGKNLDYNVEYAKSGRAACRKCEEKILKDEIRISKKDYDSDSARRYGPVDLWHHVDCFVARREELEFHEGAQGLNGFNALSAEDKDMLKKKLKKMEGKRKVEDEPDSVAPKKIKLEDEGALQAQNKKMFSFRDFLKKYLAKSEMVELLEYNNQYVPTGESKLLDYLSDLMTFGAMERCTLCNDGFFVYKFGVGYVCTGNLTEWTKCTNTSDAPQRKAFVVPKEMKLDEWPMLKKYKFKSHGNRIITKRETQKQVEEETKVKEDPDSPLNGMSFVLIGDDFTTKKDQLKTKIKSMGGKVTTKMTKTIAAVITTPECLLSDDKNLNKAKEYEIQCVSEDFLDEVAAGGALILIKKKNIASWGADPEMRIFGKKKSSAKSQFGSSQFTKNIPEKQRVKLKGGSVVDPDSELEDVSHVYQRDGVVYNCVLGMVNIARGTNSYYKMQVLQADNNKRAWLFRSWGRIGTTIGSNKLEQSLISEAVLDFEALFEEKTGNKFGAKNFQKVPNAWYPMELDYGQEDEKEEKLDVATSKSKLDKPVQTLVSLFFDIGTMKNTMVEFEIDLKKMPLGKLSSRQMKTAYTVLSEALGLLKQLDCSSGDTSSGASNGASTAASAMLVDCSNRFYTLIPHDFGMKKPPLLDNKDVINSKISMLDSLSEIELAYNLLKAEDEDSKGLDPIDKHYKKLKTSITVLGKESYEFDMIKKYIKNTHAKTHSTYALELIEVFKIQRQGEKKRFKPFKQLHNHQLLWHGSRLTNYAGILSQGLRIAPPEAPVTGYMFGKGIYFADMVSKSANYCCTSKTNSTGILLLCDVALGDMYERISAEYVEKLPKGKHSAKGMGMTCPDPEEDLLLDADLKVPLGTPVPTKIGGSSLLYNEYIVYDVAQVYVKYLVQVKFNYKY